MGIAFGPGVCGDLDEATRREWLVTDGTGSYAMGTVAGLRTRRYHGLLVAAEDTPARHQLALAALDPVLVIGDTRVRLGTFEWKGGTVDPAGHIYLIGFSIVDGLPTWRYQVGGTVIESVVAMTYGRPGVGVSYRVLAGGPVDLEISALCTWRDAHGDRFAGANPEVTTTVNGFIFEDRYRVKGPGFIPGGSWYRGVRAREEAARGLNDVEDLWFAGRFTTSLATGAITGITAWTRPHGDPGTAESITTAAQSRAREVIAASGATSEQECLLALAADQFIVHPHRRKTPVVVAGYPWFANWSRDTMISYQGLFLDTGRTAEGRLLLIDAASGISEGMVANTSDDGTTEYNTIDATLWFLHALGRHVDATGDLDLVREIVGPLRQIISRHLGGTRYGIRVDPADCLVEGGAPGIALTWMDALVAGVPVTRRPGKPVEVNALWVNALGVAARLLGAIGQDATVLTGLQARAKASFGRRFLRPDGLGLFDVVDAPDGADSSIRPNQLLAVSLPDGPFTDEETARNVVRACDPLVTPLGLRTLDPADPMYRGLHRGDAAARDRAYHQGTVWPWLIGPYLDATRRAGGEVAHVLDPLVAHLGEWGLGSVSETLDGLEPHTASGCPFQAWSVAELIRQLCLS